MIFFVDFSWLVYHALFNPIKQMIFDLTNSRDILLLAEIVAAFQYHSVKFVVDKDGDYATILFK